MWEGNRCSSKTCSEVVRGLIGLDTLQGHRDRVKFKFWYKLYNHSLPEDKKFQKLLKEYKD